MRQREPQSALPVGVRLFCCLLLGSVLAGWLNWFSPGLARADGGAPNLAYVAGAGQGVGLVDIAQRRMARTFSVTGGPDMLLLSPDGSLLYVTRPEAGSVVALAAKTGQTICSASFPGHPALLALSADSAVLYVAGLNETALLALNAQTCAVERSFQAPEPVHWLAAALSNAASGDPQTQLWLAGANAVSIVSAQGALLDRIAVPGGPQYLSVPNTLTAYVATQAGSVVALDMLAHRVIATLLSGGVFGAMDYNAVTGEIYVPDRHSQRIDVLTPVLAGMALMPREPAYTLPMPGPPQAIAITSDGQLGLAALAGGQVVMLDIPGKSTLKIVAVGGNPRFIISGAYPPATVPPPISSAAFPLFPLLAGLALTFIAAAGALAWLIRRRKKPF